MKLQHAILMILLCTGLVSCTKHHVESAPDLGYDYYPGTLHSYIVYDVDSIAYQRIQGDTLTRKFQIKEKVDSIFADNQGRPTIRLVRYRKNYNDTIPYSAMTWTVQDVWAANITKTTAEVVEENVRFIKLTFPARINATWDGNAQNTIGEWDYKYTEFDSPVTVGGIAFAKALKVRQKYFPSAIGYQNYFERYARGVGMIYKIVEDYDYQDGQGNTNPGHICEGVMYEMRINSYGVE